MVPQPDDLKTITESVQWGHILPFAAAITGEHIPENRPAMTRLLEQSFVGVIAAVIGSFVTLNVQQTEIITLKRQQVDIEARSEKALSDSEGRLTAQISELRAVLLRDKK